MTPQQQTEAKRQQQFDDTFPTLAMEKQQFAKMNNNIEPENINKKLKDRNISLLGMPMEK